jgi:CDP-glycerol glycerophosphotransferase
MTTQVMHVQFSDFVRDCTDYPDINDLMIASDLLITDYSAVAFDYAILAKPILIFAYDYDAYLAERGTYFDMAERYPSEIYRDEDALLRGLQSVDMEAASRRTAAFAREFMEYGGDATRACVDALLGEGAK